MKTATILSLMTKDRVRSAQGLFGTVTGFARDHVLVEWDSNTNAIRYTDADLVAHGIVKASPWDGEDTVS